MCFDGTILKIKKPNDKPSENGFSHWPPPFQEPLAVYSKLPLIFTVFINYVLQQYDWFVMNIASAVGSLLLVLLYNRPPWRLNTLLSLRLKSQSDNCFSEQPFETAKPCNPQCCSDGATIAEGCWKLWGSHCELVSEKKCFSELLRLG